MKLALACVTPDGYSINGINMQRSVYIDLCSQISNSIEKIGSAPIVLPETQPHIWNHRPIKMCGRNSPKLLKGLKLEYDSHQLKRRID